MNKQVPVFFCSRYEFSDNFYKSLIIANTQIRLLLSFKTLYFPNLIEKSIQTYRLNIMERGEIHY